ncbi:MAG: DUF1850 domain-containing protein [Rhodobacteraceae bacterium]|nr:DUF1850 domain-containing protein [Paracoccaceae bacterium]
MVLQAGRPVLAALFLAMPASAQPVLQILSPQMGVIDTLPLPEGEEICLRWKHSVTGGPVADCFENRNGTLVLTRSYLHDYAAGLGEVPGRGHVRPATDGNGYWIEGMNDPLPQNTLRLRTGGPAVGHHLHKGETVLALPPRARLSLHLIP